MEVLMSNVSRRIWMSVIAAAGVVAVVAGLLLFLNRKPENHPDDVTLDRILKHYEGREKP
jgi:hypothetical protein